MRRHVDPHTVNVLSLAAGAGGLDLGVKLAVPAARLVCAVEIEAYACHVLASRMEEGRLDDAPVWTDLRTFDGKPWRGRVHLVAAGYPCQPFSHAGRRRGKDDPRHLWPHVMRVLCEVAPPLVLIENVRGHVTLGFDEVREDLQRLGYGVEAGLFAAVEAGAPHRRARLFALAYHHHHGLEVLRGCGVLDGERAARGNDADGRGRAEAALGDDDEPGLEGWRLRGRGREGERAPRATGGALVDPNCERGERGGARSAGWGESSHPSNQHGVVAPFPPLPEDQEGWARYLRRWPGLEPALHRDADGMADRLDRLRLTGNGVVPHQAALAIRTLAARVT